MPFTSEELETTLRVLQEIADAPAVMDSHERFKGLVTKIHREGKRGQRQAVRVSVREADLMIREQSGLVLQQQQAPSRRLLESGTAARELRRAQSCYICKQGYTRLHDFYHLLCPDCAALSWEKRRQRADLTGRFALVTGGRIKIGYQLALRLLRDGATVLVTTRFPRDAADRFASEADFSAWRERLLVDGLDLRNLPSVEAFAEELSGRLPHLDLIVNNAAQTIKRPPEFYAALLEKESAPWLLEAQANYSGALPGCASYFLERECDADGQPIDRRPVNSWALKLDEVSTIELLEVQLVNAIAPFVLCSKLKPLLLRSPNARRFVVQASAMEGQFARASKTERHPHTNMAKAALNMLVRTSAGEWAREGIFMNAVDTGWITDENPHPKAERIRQHHHFYTPLDAIDGMARLYDPIARGLNEASEPLFGHFLKDFEPHAW
jgi:NAD(P)-dependent dehydrogenase (short-subunit alcohol dehydrogenase family)